MNEDRSVADRLTAIESLLMHLQHDVDQLHESILAGRRDVDALRSGLDRLRSDIEQLDSTPETRDPKLEKPPHY
ncbi:MAG: SlyX family protein [Planctomycetaceae bacterium]